ncbi:mitochondrial 54S ribosomal protein bL31m [Aspergillus glaucus CBS 516.65]|uniref:Ribosomal protein bL31m N-terminal domain-containing protein n=1 Tax=Aspergillus glaucus CBS 516.65 TaxID=1160497 RepID=A0A1L9VDN6_ASPGL|nr:hypothetical protein ASPGLDRAFT_131010 [Aspergillus glaucus CBS 516.65]OJJ82081.1 hypothetical protein ASPGLDRAFT_131010 [Aspergillus glaucus CBS 516.65]
MSLTTPLRRSAATTSTIRTPTTFICSQCRHATLLRRPKRPYTFTQLVTLSDGSTYTQRTTSPLPVYRSTRDTRNSLLWNPSSHKLMNVEEDEAGRLAAFRAKFGRSWDANTPTEEEVKKKEDDKNNEVAEAEKARLMAEQAKEDQEEEDNLLDLISSFGQEEEEAGNKKK